MVLLHSKGRRGPFGGLPGTPHHQPCWVLEGDRIYDDSVHQQLIVLPRNIEHDVVDANDSNQQVVLMGEEHIAPRPEEDQFANGYIDSATTTPEEDDIEKQYRCFPEDMSSWNPMAPALQAPEEELQVSDYWCENELSPLPDSCSSQGPEGEMTCPSVDFSVKIFRFP